MRVWFAAALLVGSAIALLSAQDLPPPPWHLADIEYRLPTPTPFQSLSIDVEIRGEVAPGVGLYIAPFGYGTLNGIGFYGGVQNWKNFSPENGIDPEIDRIGIFSRWDERDLKFTLTVPGGWNQSSGHEGDFIGVRAPYAWKAGRYTFHLKAAKPTRGPAGELGRWVEMTIFCHADESLARIGALFFPGEDSELASTLYSFVEIFGDRVPKAKYPRMTIVFSKFLLNGAAMDAYEVNATSPEDVPQIASVSGDGTRVIITLAEERRQGALRVKLR